VKTKTTIKPSNPLSGSTNPSRVGERNKLQGALLWVWLTGASGHF